MKNFYQFLSESTKIYNYRIRTLIPLESEELNIIENIVDQYDVVTISNPIKTPLQDSPMDFPSYSMASVYILDISLKIPVSTYILENKIRAGLNIPNSTIVVRMENDPLELETIRLNDFGNWDEREPLLSTSPINHEYNYEADNITPYGDEYNQKYLKFLAAIKKNAKDMTYEYVQPENMKKEDFPFLRDIAYEDAEYNEDYDCVKPVYQNQIDGKEDLPVKTAVHGNFDSISRLDSKYIQKGE